MATGALNWGPHIDVLTDRFRVVAIDHRGHGRGISAPFTLEACADDAVALLDVLGIDKAILAGYSMGGPIAQLAWRRHPERVSGLVLCATAATFRRTPMDAALLSLLDSAGRALGMVPPRVLGRMRRTLISMLVLEDDGLGGLAEAFAQHDLASLRAAIRAIHEFSSVEWLGGMSEPAAVVVMTRDRVVPTRRQMMLAELLPQATLVQVNGDHLACNRAASGFGRALLAACVLVAGTMAPARGARPKRLAGIGARRRWWKRTRRERRAASAQAIPARRRGMRSLRSRRRSATVPGSSTAVP
jgi:pimeloyl-ACP methyl ester carboxylesterase